jgi:hypothetical protein
MDSLCQCSGVYHFPCSPLHFLLPPLVTFYEQAQKFEEHITWIYSVSVQTWTQKQFTQGCPRDNLYSVPSRCRYSL